MALYIFSFLTVLTGIDLHTDLRFPKITDHCSQRAYITDKLCPSELRRQKRMIRLLRIPLINQHNHAAVGLGADDSARRLQNTVEPGINIRILASEFILIVIVLAHKLPFIAWLQQAYADDHRTDQPVAGKIDSL